MCPWTQARPGLLNIFFVGTYGNKISQTSPIRPWPPGSMDIGEIYTGEHVLTACQ